MTGAPGPAAYPAEKRIELMLKDYEQAVSRMNVFSDRIVQALGVGGAAFAALVGFVITQRAPSSGLPQITVEVAWLLPFILLGLYAVIIYIAYAMVSYFWICRVIGDNINILAGDKAMIQFDRLIPSSVFFSSQRGSPKYNVLTVLVIILALMMLGGVLVVSLETIGRESGPLWRTIFILTCGAAAAADLLAVHGLYNDFPNSYRAFIQIYRQHGLSHALDETRQKQVGRAMSTIWFVIAPRPADAIRKGIFFWIGFFSALLLMGLRPERVDEVRNLFSGLPLWQSVADAPLWAILSMGLLYFIVEEFILQQAKLLWNDVRDKPGDVVLLISMNRPVARGAISEEKAVRHAVLRWLLAFVLGALLGGWPIVLLFLVISIHQAIYVLWLKPNADRFPVLTLLGLSFNVMLRFAVGFYVVAGAAWGLTFSLLIMAVLYCYSIGVMSGIWKMEAAYYKETPFVPRTQSGFFFRRGELLQRLGLIGAVLISTLLVVDRMISIPCVTGHSLIAQWYGGCLNGVTQYVQLDPLAAIGAFVLACLIALAVAGIILLIFYPLRRAYARFIRRARSSLLLITIVAMTSAIIIALWSWSLAAWAGYILLNHVLHFLRFEGLTYPEYAFDSVIKQLGAAGRLWYAYLFQDPKIHKLTLRDVLFAPFSQAPQKRP